MPWSPIPKFPEIIQFLKQKGYTKEVPFLELRKGVMLKTGAIKDQTIKTIIIAMEDLDFVKNLGNNFFLIEPEKWKKEMEKEKKEKLKKEQDAIDKRLDDLAG